MLGERRPSLAQGLGEKTVLLTGAAGGLGAPATLAFLQAGARVVAVDNNSQKASQLRAQAASEGLSRLTILESDLADPASLRRDILAACDPGGRLDIVVNNAAVYPSKPFEEFSLEEHQAVQRVNVDAAIVCAQLALPGMRDAGWGRIINIASITFYGGWANLSPYVQSKGALVGLTRAWAREFGGYGVTVNAIAPGAFPTDAEKIHPDPQGYARFVLDHQAIKRRGHPDDIARVLMFLASEDAAFITGQTINVDGGWVMH
jgi:NAD(P)-dependent dehydrogenase (short-subunit alcohol dehydrogenase family)